jgi:hypothetical protein
VKQSQRNGQENRDRRALLGYALLRWESAAVLGLTLILVILVPDPFGGVLPFWRWWFWLILGGLAEILIVTTTIQDPGVRAGLAGERIQARLAPNTIANVDYRQAAERALRHRAAIELMFQRTRRREERELLQPIVDDVTHWTERLVRLAQHLDDHAAQANVLAPTVQAPAKAYEQAQAQLEHSLHALEATYARLQLSAAQGLNERRVKQLRGEIAGQVRVLQETMESLS